MAAVLLSAFELQCRAAVDASTNSNTAVVALTAMIDQETGVRGFLYTGQEAFLDPYVAGRTAYQRDRQMVTHAAAGDGTSARLAAAEDAAASAWGRYAATVVAARRASSAPPVIDAQQELYGKQQMDAFRASNTALRSRLDQRRNALLAESGFVWTTVIVALAGLFAMFG